MSETSIYQPKQIAERIPKFITTTYQMLDDPRYQEYMGWSQDGCALLIKKPVEFAENVLPVFFKHNNFSSFVRQLNLYNFRKKKHYPFDNAFVHGMFKRGQKGLLGYIKRKGSDKYTDYSQEAPRYIALNIQEANPGLEELIRQNGYLKKIHRDLIDYVQTIEEKVDNLSRANEALHVQYSQKSQNEELLKEVVRKFCSVHGEDTIKKIVKSVMEQHSTNVVPEKDGRNTDLHLITRNTISIIHNPEPMNSKTEPIKFVSCLEQPAKNLTSGLKDSIVVKDTVTVSRMNFPSVQKAESSGSSHDTDVASKREEMIPEKQSVKI